MNAFVWSACYAWVPLSMFCLYIFTLIYLPYMFSLFISKGLI